MSTVTNPVSDPVTIPAAEMVRLTGVGRERLRTWERRHEFPTPTRCRNNVRRYLADDVPRVIVVSRLVDQGVPLSEAIEQASAIPAVPSEITSLGPVLDHAPVPAVALSGGEPLRVVWANGAARARAVPPNLGETAMEALPELDAEAWGQLRRLISGESPGAEVLGESVTGRRWLSWRVPHEEGNAPAVVLVHVVAGELPAPVIAAPAERPTSFDGNSEAQWATAVREARQVLRSDGGPAAAQRALAALTHRLGAVDAFLATCQGGKLRSATSVRGMISGATLDLEPDLDIARSIAAGEVEWVGPCSREYLGIPPHLQAVCAPILVNGSPCGAAFIVLEEDLPLGVSARELLVMLGGVLGSTLLRRH